ncbi:MAG: dicarboxylate/amino acid:cation symporter [Myxococcota bacterium]
MDEPNGAPSSDGEPQGMQLYTKILIGMFVGVSLGFFLGPNSNFLSADAAVLSKGVPIMTTSGGTMEAPIAQGVERVRVLEEQSGVPVPGADPAKAEATSTWLRVEWTLTSADVMRFKAKDVKVKRGDVHSGWVLNDAMKVRRYSSMGQQLVDWTEWLGRLFLAMIKMVVVPLVFFSLIVGMASLGDFRKLGRMGGTTLGFFTLTTVVALTIGLGITNLIEPGSILSELDKKTLLGSFTADKVVSSAAGAPSFVDQIVGIVPSNPIASLAAGDMLQVIFFATMLGIAFTLMKADVAKRAVDLCVSINEAMVVLVHVAMKLAPVGVAAILFEVVGSTGLGVLAALGAYGGVVILGLLTHILVMYMPVIIMGAKLPFFGFLQSIRAALVLAFSTSSSSATLPVSMEACENNLNCSNEVASFVLPIGATVNMDGTALYQGVAAVFIAQVFDIDLTLGDQATIVVSATMASIGAAGVPGAGMLTLAMVLAAIGVPVQGVALVIGVDRLLDMFRTATNVVGDCTATSLVARLQGENIGVLTPEQDAADPNRGMEGRLVDVAPQSIDVEDED